MFNIGKIKRNAGAIVRAEMNETIERFKKASLMMDKIIDEKPTFDPNEITIEEYKNRQVKMLWELVYEPYYNELLALLKKINKKDGSN